MTADAGNPCSWNTRPDHSIPLGVNICGTGLITDATVFVVQNHAALRNQLSWSHRLTERPDTTCYSNFLMFHSYFIVKTEHSEQIKLNETKVNNLYLLKLPLYCFHAEHHSLIRAVVSLSNKYNNNNNNNSNKLCTLWSAWFYAFISKRHRL